MSCCLSPYIVYLYPLPWRLTAHGCPCRSHLSGHESCHLSGRESCHQPLIHSSAALHIFTYFCLNFASIFGVSKNYFRHFSQCLQGFREVSEFFCCFFFGVCNNSTRSQGTGQPIRRTARQQAVMMRDRHEIKKSLTALAHQRQDRRNQSSRFPTDNHGTVHVRPSTRSNSVHRESAGGNKAPMKQPSLRRS